MLAPSQRETRTGSASLSVRPVMEAVDVERRFRNGRGVGPVTISVQSGERVALMGPNGAGKTTLLDVLATAARPRAGSVRWYGMTSPRKARRLIGTAADVVTEDGALTARQSTYFWCRQWMPHDLTGGLVDEALRQFGLAGVADDPVASFSFGMRRRLALGQALVHRPRLALLDEPTAGLDPDGVTALTRVMKERTRQGRATIVASNDCEFVAAACDRVVFLDAGVLLTDATPKALLAHVGSARVVELEMNDRSRLRELRRIPGVAAVVESSGLVTVEMRDERALPAIVSAADGDGGGLVSLRLHTPDLADAFRVLTGRGLDGEASPSVPPARAARTSRFARR
ncbi:MAG: ABC transporter ATP-binding protein [Candidatus Dormibacteraeota bacterium]|nr:ABC transporter ATP-binding protein [Candidatus Dormibacteraeota bacterium]